jgi:ribosomal protein S18 acetylase RimI-like enzyme
VTVADLFIRPIGCLACRLLARPAPVAYAVGERQTTVLREIPAALRSLVHRRLLGHEELTVRVAVPSDAPAIAELDLEFNEVLVPPAHVARSLEAGIAGAGEIVAICYAGAEPAGFACAQARRSCCYLQPTGEITELYVRPKHRRKRVGGSLLSLLEKELARRGVEEITVLTGGANHAAKALYASHGFSRKDWVAFERAPAQRGE